MENNNQELNNQVNTNNNQQVQPNNNKILIILMALIIVGLAGYIVYVKFIQKSDNPEPKPNNTEENGNVDNNQVTPNPGSQETTNYSDWMNYILNQSNLKVEAIRYDCGDESNNKTVELTIEQLKSFFENNKDNELINYIMDGTGDSDCGDYLSLSYSANGKNESLEIQENRLWAITDTSLYDVLKNSNIRVDDTECTAENKECYSGYYGFKNIISFDEYFK